MTDIALGNKEHDSGLPGCEKKIFLLVILNAVPCALASIMSDQSMFGEEDQNKKEYAVVCWLLHRCPPSPLRITYLSRRSDLIHCRREDVEHRRLI